MTSLNPPTAPRTEIRPGSHLLHDSPVGHLSRSCLGTRLKGGDVRVSTVRPELRAGEVLVRTGGASTYSRLLRPRPKAALFSAVQTNLALNPPTPPLPPALRSPPTPPLPRLQRRCTHRQPRPLLPRCKQPHARPTNPAPYLPPQLFDYRTLHRGRGNASSETRPCLYLVFSWKPGVRDNHNTNVYAPSLRARA